MFLSALFFNFTTMDRQSHDFITNLLTEEWNYLQAEIKYLDHQRTLPPEHRKIDNDELELGTAINSLYKTSVKVEAAINQMKQVKIED